MLRLLFITQKVDERDDVLGFMHGWLKRFAGRVDKLTVICLERGEHHLPKNVRVLSLGKETTRARLQHIAAFYRYVWRYRREYDTVFVHMNPIYVVLAGLFWRTFKKRVILWFNHTEGSLIARLGVALAHVVCHTSPFAFSARFKKAVKMPAGIDTGSFRRMSEINKEQNSLLFVGRISPVKRLEILIEALDLLDKRGIEFRLHVYGETGRKKVDAIYYAQVENRSKGLLEKGKVVFHGAVANIETPKIYNQGEVFINLTSSGSLDKTTLEAMACETLVLVSNKSFQGVLPEMCMFQEGSPKDLAGKLTQLLALPQDIREGYLHDFRAYVVVQHDLSILIERTLGLMS